MPGIISIGTRAMFAAQAQIGTAAANISNANTPGYSRQTVQLETAGGQFTGAGFFGKGVDITTVARAHDQFLSREVTLTRATAAADQARLEQLQRMEKIFDLGESGLGSRVSQLLNAYVDIGNNPNDPAARQVVLSRAESLASQVRSVSGQLASLQKGVTEDLKTSIDTVNEIVRRIADLNQQIARVKGFGHEPNDLLDQRERLINDLSQHISVTQIPADDGTVGLFIAGGQRLLLGNNALPLVAVPDTYDNTRFHVGVLEGGVTRQLNDAALGGGSIAGLLRFQAEDLTAAMNEVGRLATVLAARMNEQQSLGLTSGGASGPALFSVGAPRVLPSSTNTGGATVSITISDATELTAGDFEFSRQGGAWQIRRLPNGSPEPYVPGRYGITLTVTGAANEGDRFLVEPVRLAGTDMRALLTDPQDLAAAAPVAAKIDPANQGTAAVVSLQPKSADPNLTQPLTITFTSATTFTVTGTVSPPAPTSLTPGQPLEMNGWALQLSGVPKPGDVITIDPSHVSATNNGNALAMLALRDEAMVAGATLTDAYAGLTASVGVRVMGAKTAAEMSSAVAKDAEVARNNVSGVNLDEEAARLIQFQQAYQAAAKVLQVAQSVFDTLLQTAAR
ncbi:MAG TPA: flagellar hook-associated protein FlgK [Burkholderiaceae bacterium]|nr:flagellar hook-associated protein FlgK [Burkholderiaceae bacterium]